MKVLLSKQKENSDREFTTNYFNSTAKTVITFNNYGLNKSFQQVLYRLDNWINAWTAEYIDEEYINVSIYSTLSGSTYIKLSNELRNLMKGLINVKNNDNKCFLWCHERHLNPLKTRHERIKKVDKTMADNLDCKGIYFPVSKKDYEKIEQKNNICINVFCYGNSLIYPVNVSKQKIEDCIDLLLINDENKSSYAYIKDYKQK